MNATVLSHAGVQSYSENGIDKFATDVWEGLSQQPKRLYSKYFYDAEGDKLFQEIMASPEYYPTNCELEIFRDRTAELAEMMTSANAPFDLVELGAGDATKSQHLLKYLADRDTPFTYMPIDISGHILDELQVRLNNEIPQLTVSCLSGEYLDMLDRAMSLSSRRKIVLFLGANIGNMESSECIIFCKQLRERLRPGDLALIGFDLKKHPRIVRAAYDDKEGITARFNLNLLQRINRELGADFHIDQFEHYQTYDPVTGACRSYLVSLQAQRVNISGRYFNFSCDEVIYMEISQKYSPQDIVTLAGQSGFIPIHTCYDSKGWFADVFWEAM